VQAGAGLTLALRAARLPATCPDPATTWIRVAPGGRV